MGRVRVAIHAFCNKGFGLIFFRLVGGMAGTAGHVRLLKTKACFKQLHLLPVHVGFMIIRCKFGIKEMGQGIPGDKSKKGS